MLKRILVGLFVGVILMTGTANAGPLEDGLSAYDRGNYAEAQVQVKERDYCTLGLWPEDIESVNLTPENRRCAEENAAREERMRNGTETVEDWEIWGAQRRARETGGPSRWQPDRCRQGYAVYRDGNGFELAFDAEESFTTWRAFTIRNIETGKTITQTKSAHVTWSNGYSVAHYVVSFECLDDWMNDCGAEGRVHSGRVYSLNSQPDAIPDIPLMENKAAETILFVGIGSSFYYAARERLGDVWRLTGCEDEQN